MRERIATFHKPHLVPRAGIKKKTVSISSALLSGMLRERFETMLPVVAGRSTVQWELSGVAEADVVLRESVLPGDDGISLYISDDASFDVPALLRVERAFRVNALMEVLDRAAARVLKHPDSVASPSQAATVDRSADLYQLKYWVVPRYRVPMSVLCALAAMTRRPVSREWLMTEGRLGPASVDFLLIELKRRGALYIDRAGSAEAALGVPAGFMTRLKHWLRGGRAASSSVTMTR